MVGSLGTFSNSLIKGPRILYRRTLVFPQSSSQDTILNLRECGFSFTSMVSSVTSFFINRVDSEEVLISLSLCSYNDIE